MRDAFYELVLYPTKASALVTELYITAGKNRLYAMQGRASTNDLAAKVRTLFQADAELSAEYNHKLAGGKWNHMMDQTHSATPRGSEPPEKRHAGGAGSAGAVPGGAWASPSRARSRHG